MPRFARHLSNALLSRLTLWFSSLLCSAIHGGQRCGGFFLQRHRAARSAVPGQPVVATALTNEEIGQRRQSP